MLCISGPEAQTYQKVPYFQIDEGAFESEATLLFLEKLRTKDAHGCCGFNRIVVDNSPRMVRTLKEKVYKRKAGVATGP